MMEINVTYQIGDEEEKLLQSIVEKYQKQGVHFTKESAFDFIMRTGSVYDIERKMKFHEQMLDAKMDKEPKAYYRKMGTNEMEQGNSKKSAYNILMDNRKELVDRLIEQMEKGYAETRAAWSRNGLGRPYNPLSKAVYRGGNRFRLMIAAEENGFKDPRWLTFKQASENNLKIKPGSKGVMLEKWIFYKEVPVMDENQQPVVGENGKPVKELKRLEKPQANYFWVFNGEQVEGLPELEKKTLSEDMYSKMADDFVRSSRCPIYFGLRDEAFYSPSKDEINMPAKESFKSNQARLAVQLHEMAHSTGHPDRLNRPLENSFGSTEYAKEELNAELSSIFLESELGITLESDSEALKDHSNYIKSWISVLKDNPNELFNACNVAEKVTDYLKKNYEQVLQLEQTKEQQMQGKTEQVNSTFYIQSFEVKDQIYMANIIYDGKNVESAVWQQGEDYYVSVGSRVERNLYRHLFTKDEKKAFYKFVDEQKVKQSEEKIGEVVSEKIETVHSLTENNVDSMVADVHSLVRNMFEGVVSDLEKSGIWGAWMGDIVNHSNPNEYFHVDMTGNETVQEIKLDITCVKDNKIVSTNSFSIKALDIWKKGTLAFDEQPIKDALAKSLESGKFTLNSENGRTSFDMYSTLSDDEDPKKHYQMLEQSGKSARGYYDFARISGDISKCGFKPTESLIENIYKFSEMEGKHFTLRQLAALNKSKPDFSDNPKKMECFNSIIKECQEQEMARTQNSTHFMKQEMMMEIMPTPGT